MKKLTAILMTSALCAAASAHAQKITPGLWEHTFTMKMQGGEMEAGMARMQEQMARMSPEQRKQVEQMMGGAGGGPGMAMMTGKPTTVKICLTPEQAARDEIPQSQENCQQTSQSRSGNTVKFAFTCTGEHQAKGEGEYTLINDKAHKGRMSVEGSLRGGKSERMDMEQSARWLGADCGDVKPRGAKK